jgi:hypothetical protein
MFQPEQEQYVPAPFSLDPHRNTDHLHKIPVRNSGNYGMAETRSHNRKPKNPDTYNGQNVEWKDYICHFELQSLDISIRR